MKDFKKRAYFNLKKDQKTTITILIIKEMLGIFLFNR